MIIVWLKNHDPQKKAEIENRLNGILPKPDDVARDWNGDYTMWAVEAMTEEEFDLVREIDWRE